MPHAKIPPQATWKLLQETSRAIVTEWRFAPGAETGWHRYAHDYIVVVLTAGKLMQETANGEIVTELASRQSYAREAGVEHNVVNPNPHEFVFVEVELRFRGETQGLTRYIAGRAVPEKSGDSIRHCL